MAEDSLRSAIDALTRRLHEEIEAQLAEVGARHQEEIEAVRRAAEAESEERWSVKVEEVRAEWMARLESEISATRAEAERRTVAESLRLRVEAEQAAAESAVRARRELEQTLSAERSRAAEELTAERQHRSSEREHLQRELAELRRQLTVLEQDLGRVAAARGRAESALEEERRAHSVDVGRQEQSAAAAAEARVAERQSQLAAVERLLGGIRSLDSARSLTHVLTALLSSAAAEAPRVALFVRAGSELRTWKAQGFGSREVGPGATNDGGLLAEVLRRGEPVSTSDTGPAAPDFAHLPSDRAAIAVPLLVGAQPVGVLYADDGDDGPAQAPAPWPEAIEILCRHASVSLAHLTAARSAEVMRRSLVPSAPDPVAAAPAGDDSNRARRYARLLISEIKMYHEPAVRLGRQNHDLLARLSPEIDRARRLYEERISSSVEARGVLFHEELVQTLAGGDPALLGGSA